MMTEKVIEYLGLCEDAKVIIQKTYKTICLESEYKQMTQMLYEKKPFAEIEKILADFSKRLDINEHTLYMTLLLSNVHIMFERYEKAGISEEIFWDTITDFKCKIDECVKNYGVFGIFSRGWYGNIFELGIFRLGRLEFGLKKLEDGGNCINIHIPSGSPLKHEDVIESYKKAYNFFEKTHGEMMAFVCRSYLMYPEFKKHVYKEGTNTYKFVDDFEILKVYDDFGTFTSAWRVFNKPYNGDVSELPQDTSLQRAYVEYMKKSDKFGAALGAFMFDGEKIHKEKAKILTDVV